MKTLNRIMIIGLVATALVACDKHDKLDELVYVGPMAPTVYWSVENAVANAGDSVSFEAQYYTTGQSPIDHLEVWYDVIEIEAKEVSAPLLSTFSYTVSSTVETTRRISTPAARYAHSEDFGESYGVDSMGKVTHFKTTYRMKDKFPTSNTLSTIAFSDATWDSAQVIKYFGDGFMQKFKDTIEIQLKGCAGYGKGAGYSKDIANAHWSDYKSVWVNMAGMDGKVFAALSDSALNEEKTRQQGQEVYDYFFKSDVAGVPGDLPNAVDSAYLGVEFKDLIYNGNEYKINFKRSYKLNSQFRAYDQAGVYGLSLIAVVELN